MTRVYVRPRTLGRGRKQTCSVRTNLEQTSTPATREAKVRSKGFRYSPLTRGNYRYFTTMHVTRLGVVSSVMVYQDASWAWPNTGSATTHARFREVDCNRRIQKRAHAAADCCQRNRHAAWARDRTPLQVGAVGGAVFHAPHRPYLNLTLPLFLSPPCPGSGAPSLPN